MRIGELSKRVGVSPELLRAWERRYGIAHPSRSSGGFRLYSPADEAQVRRMRGHLARGASAAEAARLAGAHESEAHPPASVETAALGVGTVELAAALESFDDARAQLLLDKLFVTYSLETFLTDVLLAYLNHLGERWEQGEVTVAQEHFATNIVRGRLFGLARGWDLGEGPRALLAAPPGEHHELALIIFGLALRRHGWRITYLGVNTPVEAMIDVAQALGPRIAVISATMQHTLWNYLHDLTELTHHVSVGLAGPGASDPVAAATGARWIDGDPVSAARTIAALK